MALDFSGLNKEQQDAVTTLQGALLILAGAGTGKTTVITYRIAYLLECGVLPENVLAVTFTNKAAAEMKERVTSMVGPKRGKKLTVCTFHAFCMIVLHQYAPRLGYGRDFSLADFGDQKGIVRQALGKLGYGDDGLDEQYYLSQISNAKNRELTAKNLKESQHAEEQKLGYVYEFYQDYLFATNVMDFDDLLLQTLKLFREFPEVLNVFQERYRYLMVDEFQDTNYVQMEIVNLVAGETQNLCVVGDDDQSIYSWRGAEVENILNFPNNYRDCKLIKLEQNYRSTNHILKSANKLIAVNSDRHDKNLWSGNGDGETVKVVKAQSAEKEGMWVAQVIAEKKARREFNYGEIAILYRSNHQSRLIEMHLRKKGIPYRVVGDQSFYERREIRDAIAFLTIIRNPNDNMCMLRILDVPPRGIGNQTIMKLRQEAEFQRRPVYDLMRDEQFHVRLTSAVSNSIKNFVSIIDRYRAEFDRSEPLYQTTERYLKDIGYIDGLVKMYKPKKDAEVRYENLLELFHSIHYLEDEFEGTMKLDDYLQKVSLREEFNRRKEDEEEVNCVTLLTVHASKGLEYPVVFVVGMEQNIFPHERSIKSRDITEERRLCYVAITRAKKELYLFWAATRLIRQTLSQRKRSQFLLELPDESHEHCEPSELFKIVSKEDATAHLQAFMDTLKK